MSLTLKNCVSPWKACDQQLVFSQEVKLSEFERLTNELLENQGVIMVDVAFGRNIDNLAVLTGKITGQLVIQCQRCLLPMELAVDFEMNLALVRAITDETHELDSIYDVFEIEDDQICLKDVIEDELFLQIPQVPMHTEPSCVIETEFGDESVEAAAEEKENPFAVLASLKDKLN
jgi:uncharacterized protein